MAAVSVLQAPSGGFSFDNCARNSLLEAELVQKGQRLPAPRKTGTTIAGVVYKDGVVLGADTRATEGMVVADKNCSKIHFISPNIYCCGAGTAADTEMTTQMISSNLELHSLSTGRLPRVVTANRMLKQMLFRYQGYIGASLVLGGVDVTGPHLYSIYPHGSTDKLPYVTMGSGSLAAMAVFEDKYKQDMEHCIGGGTDAADFAFEKVPRDDWSRSPVAPGNTGVYVTKTALGSVFLTFQ
ncbi:proteasome subunit beta type-7 isoform X2 [Rissa tridactyla]|uniref:proteasome subunit beta type-7 isoform X2 n=1 Tax=Rissa tridactyla TaxID=75485 RepID=UPI0023BADE74|nr:proteasome subunit beta type-7 isoform X2 [Rissa tridactyla]